MRGLLIRVLADSVEHQVRVDQDGLVAEAKHREPAAEQVCVTGLIRLLPQAMDASIDLDHQLQLVTAEVADPWPDLRLAPELPALEPPTAQQLPHRRLGDGHLRPEALSLARHPLIRLASRA